ncbi:hypothetical protein HK104_006333, partial [Borealophlyctis nickersoniae]
MAQILMKYKLVLKREVELRVVHTTTGYWIQNDAEVVAAIGFEARKDVGLERVDSAVDLL